MLPVLLATLGPAALVGITSLLLRASPTIPRATPGALRNGAAAGVLAALFIMLVFCPGMAHGYQLKLICLGLGAACGAAAGMAIALLRQARLPAQRAAARPGMILAGLVLAVAVLTHLFTGIEIHFFIVGAFLVALWFALLGLSLARSTTERDEIAAVEHIIEEHKHS